MIHMDVGEIRIDEFVSLLTVLEDVIEIQEKRYLIKILGSNLRIVSMNGHEIVCDGMISEVIFL